MYATKGKKGEKRRASRRVFFFSALRAGDFFSPAVRAGGKRPTRTKLYGEKGKKKIGASRRVKKIGASRRVKKKSALRADFFSLFSASVRPDTCLPDPPPPPMDSSLAKCPGGVQPTPLCPSVQGGGPAQLAPGPREQGGGDRPNQPPPPPRTPDRGTSGVKKSIFSKYLKTDGESKEMSRDLK